MTHIVKPNSLPGWLAALSLVSGLAFIAAPANAAAPSRGDLSASDYHFAVTADQGDQMEVNLGQLAQQKSQNPKIQQFAQRMVQDHSQANTQLEQIVAGQHASLPAATSQKSQAEMAQLENMQGKQFDRAYIDLMVRDHKEDLKKFQKASQNANDPALKNFAAQTEQVIQRHLQLAKTIQDQLDTERK